MTSYVVLHFVDSWDLLAGILSVVLAPPEGRPILECVCLPSGVLHGDGALHLLHRPDNSAFL